MVWARTKLLIWDYVFEPVKQIKIRYSGRNPEKVYKKMNELMRTVFNIPEAYIQERNYTWEKIEDTERFDIQWDLSKILDMFSYIYVEINLNGFTTQGEGRAEIIIKPRLITEYPQDTVWQQSIVYEMLRRLWHRMFYHHKRMEFLNMSKETLVTFERSIKSYMEKLREGS
jgi:hypothetical protein